MSDAVQHPTGQAWRIATACLLTFLCTQGWQLSHANLGVWTTFMVMINYPNTVFQKGIERLVGRIVGVLLGLAVTTVLGDAAPLVLYAEALLLVAFFYVASANRLTYTFLNAGLYTVVLVDQGLAQPDQAASVAWELIVVIGVGVVVADLVAWLTGAEQNLSLQTSGPPLWPLRAEWLSHSLMLATTVMLTQLVTHWLELPIEKATISVMVLCIAPDVQSAMHKGKLRLLGAVLAVLWACASFLILVRQPYVELLAASLFLGQFVAGYAGRVWGSDGYAGIQMGLVLPLILVVPQQEVGDLRSVLQRIEGIFVGVGMTLLVGTLWPRWGPADQRK
ncbi:MAG: FUSC family protein [Gemmataceae bacterium]